MRKSLLFAALILVLPVERASTYAETPQEERADVQIEESLTPPQSFLFRRFEISSLHETYPIELRETRQLEKTIAALGADRFGPVEYHIDFGFDRDGPIFLDVAAQILDRDDAAALTPPEGYEVKETAPYQSLALTFKGSPIDVSEMWSALETHALNGDYLVSGQNREILVDHSGFVAENYVTTLMMGIEAVEQ